jgi:hypothetical protein
MYGIFLSVSENRIRLVSNYLASLIRIHLRIRIIEKFLWIHNIVFGIPVLYLRQFWVRHRKFTTRPTRQRLSPPLPHTHTASTTYILVMDPHCFFIEMRMRMKQCLLVNLVNFHAPGFRSGSAFPIRIRIQDSLGQYCGSGFTGSTGSACFWASWIRIH